MELRKFIATTIKEYLNERQKLNYEVKTLYHGNKSSGKLSDINFDNHTYFYLTPIYRYALDYAKGNKDGVTELEIDVSKLLDLRSFNVNKIDAKTFYQKTKQYFPAKVLTKNPNSALWELIRLDFDGEIKKTFQNRGFDGLIIIEKKNDELFESYVLFNSNPIIDRVKNFKQFVNENVENLTTLYHGTSDDKDVIDRNYMFLSTSPTFAKKYGDKILQVKVNVGKVFNTLLLLDIQLLYKNGFKLYDPNVDEDWDDIGYNFNKDEFRTAKAFINSPTNDNTWDAIESTEGVVEWIFNNGFDSILITEDGVENYICKKQNIKNIEEYHI